MPVSPFLSWDVQEKKMVASFTKTLKIQSIKNASNKELADSLGECWNAALERGYDHSALAQIVIAEQNRRSAVLVNRAVITLAVVQVVLALCALLCRN